MSDTEAISAIKQGDRDRYAELVKRYEKMVYGIAWSRLGDADLCEDAAQETFIKAFRYLAALRNPEKFGGWLARIARNASTSILRQRLREIDKHKQWQVLQAKIQPNEEPTEEEPTSETLRNAMADLPDQHRESLILFYLEGKSVSEVAQVLGISEAAVKTRLHRARHTLRGTLEEKLETSLSALGPRKGFAAGVMLLLPHAPLATTSVGGASAGAKAAGFFGKLAFPLTLLFWMSLIQASFFALMFGLFGWMESANLVSGPGRSFRKKLIRSDVIFFTLLSMSAILFAVVVPEIFGPRAFYTLLTLLCAWGTYSAARMLRVNRSPHTYGILLANTTFLTMFILIGFFHTPFFLTFPPTLIVLNIILYHTNKTVPKRRDYNLFLRQAAGLLGEPGPSVSKRLRITRGELLAFVRFIGERFLVRDYSFDVEGIVLRLPPVKLSWRESLGLSGSNSQVTIGFDGSCEANLGDKDLRHLHGILEGTMIEKDILEARVAKVVKVAFHAFLDGHTDQAEHLLQPETDESIFAEPIAKSKGTPSSRDTRDCWRVVRACFRIVACSECYIRTASTHDGQSGNGTRCYRGVAATILPAAA